MLIVEIGGQLHMTVKGRDLLSRVLGVRPFLWEIGLFERESSRKVKHGGFMDPRPMNDFFFNELLFVYFL